MDIQNKVVPLQHLIIKIKKTMKQKLIYNLILACVTSCVSVYIVGVPPFISIPCNLVGFTFKAMYDQIQEQGEEIENLKNKTK